MVCRHNDIVHKANRCSGDPSDAGPMQEYNARVASGKLRNDEHQRGIHTYVSHLAVS